MMQQNKRLDGEVVTTSNGHVFRTSVLTSENEAIRIRKKNILTNEAHSSPITVTGASRQGSSIVIPATTSVPTKTTVSPNNISTTAYGGNV